MYKKSHKEKYPHCFARAIYDQGSLLQGNTINFTYRACLSLSTFINLDFSGIWFFRRLFISILPRFSTWQQSCVDRDFHWMLTTWSKFNCKISSYQDHQTGHMYSESGVVRFQYFPSSSSSFGSLQLRLCKQCSPFLRSSRPDGRLFRHEGCKGLAPLMPLKMSLAASAL